MDFLNRVFPEDGMIGAKSESVIAERQVLDIRDGKSVVPSTQ